MPTYDYKCPTCDARQSETFTIDVTLPAPTCPNPDCDTKMVRVYTVPGVTFKGNGWAHKDKGPRK